MGLLLAYGEITARLPRAQINHPRSPFRIRGVTPDLPRIPASLVLVGLMGAGKSSVGRRLAQKLELPFVDADSEIESAAGCSIEDFFELYGEEEFRDGERRVISRLLDGPVQVIATGGGAFMNEETRGKVRDMGISIWLKADLDTLVERVSRRGGRPLLRDAPAEDVLNDLIDSRYPVYEEADITVESGDGSTWDTVDRTLDALDHYLRTAGAQRQWTSRANA